MNSGHEQTEADRTGFFGPYALVITTGAAPSGTLDTSFFDQLNLQGYVPASQRGTVRGTYSGVLSGLPITVGFKVRRFVVARTLILMRLECIERSSSILGDGERVCTFVSKHRGVAELAHVLSNSFTSPLMKPGQYTATLYEGELESGTATARISYPTS